MIADCHPRQADRLNALRSYQILDTPREGHFDDIVALVSRICEVPVAVINLIDSDRQWFKAEVGLGVRSTPLDTSLCSHVILQKGFLEIPDTLEDPRMADNPLCTAEGGFRFYAGALLVARDDLPIGTLCVLDTKPRHLTDLQSYAVKVLAHQVMNELNLRLAARESHLLRREIDHRVKNSLSSVNAIIALQAHNSKSPETRTALNSIQSRIGALESLHEELQQDSNNREVDMQRLINRSVSKLRRLVPGDVTFDVAVAPDTLPSDVANAIALTVNEFVTNSAKHAFRGGHGTLRIRAEESSAGYCLMCRDDGIGDGSTLTAIAESAGLGSRIILTLAKSVGATVEWSAADPGITLDWFRPAQPTIDPPMVRE